MKHASSVVAASFDQYMQKKGFSGSVVFNHEEGTLTIQARPDNLDELTQVEDIRQLSGGKCCQLVCLRDSLRVMAPILGERSFTTLSLLLALGHVIDCPFRVMDEYDVFLDQLARKITLTQLTEYANDPLQEGRQFIILTPQDLSDVNTSDGRVKISRMATPDRGRQPTIGEALGLA